MDPEKLKKIEAQGKRIPPPKDKAGQASQGTERRSLRSALKKLSMTTSVHADEANMIKDDGAAARSDIPEGQASLPSQTTAISGPPKPKSIFDTLPDILSHLRPGPEEEEFRNSLPRDDEIPGLIEYFENATKNNFRSNHYNKNLKHKKETQIGDVAPKYKTGAKRRHGATRNVMENRILGEAWNNEMGNMILGEALKIETGNKILGEAPKYEMDNNFLGEALKKETESKILGEAPENKMGNYILGEAPKNETEKKILVEAPKIEMGNKNLWEAPKNEMENNILGEAPKNEMD